MDARGGVDDRSPLFLAALAKRWGACAWLLERGASKSIRDKKGLTAYQAMAGSSDPEVCGEGSNLCSGVIEHIVRIFPTPVKQQHKAPKSSISL